MLEPDRPQTTWRMCIACWLHEIKNICSDYVIVFVFPLQKWIKYSPQCYFIVHCLPCLSVIANINPQISLTTSVKFPCWLWVLILPLWHQELSAYIVIRTRTTTILLGRKHDFDCELNPEDRLKNQCPALNNFCVSSLVIDIITVQVVLEGRLNVVWKGWEF